MLLLIALVMLAAAAAAQDASKLLWHLRVDPEPVNQCLFMRDENYIILQ